MNLTLREDETTPEWVQELVESGEFKNDAAPLHPVMRHGC
jgi:Arc/MetJ-type ribon-helix-helix transcriptional regulator